MQKQWEALIRRALCRASGQDPPKRGKHWKSGLNSKDSSLVEEESNKKELILENLKYDTMFVDTQTDLKSLFANHFNDDDDAQSDEKMGLIGLHTCGDLASNSLQIFLANDDSVKSNDCLYSTLGVRVRDFTF